MKTLPRARIRALLAIVAVPLLATLGPGALETAARSAAALTLEALPLLLVADLLASGRPSSARRSLARGLTSVCCGPDGRAASAASAVSFVAGALALGLPLALARASAAAATGLLRRRRRTAAAHEPHADGRCRATHAERTVPRGATDASPHASPLAQRLASIALAGAVASPAAALAGAVAGRTHAPLLPALAAGLALGATLPCGIGAIALASALGRVAPGLAAGVLAASGIVSWPRRSPRRERPPDGGEPASVAPALAGVCALAATLGGAALVNPRLVPLLWLGAAAGLATAVRRRPAAPGGVAVAPCPDARAAVSARTGASAPALSWRGSRAALVPLGLAAAVLAPSPHAPAYAVEAAFDGGAPGERVDFTGVVMRDARGVRIGRWEVTCCIADATLVDLALAGDPHVPAGGWVRVRGRLVRTSAGLRLAVTGIERLATPRDPYAYA